MAGFFERNTTTMAKTDVFLRPWVLSSAFHLLQHVSGRPLASKNSWGTQHRWGWGRGASKDSVATEVLTFQFAVPWLHRKKQQKTDAHRKWQLLIGHDWLIPSNESINMDKFIYKQMWQIQQLKMIDQLGDWNMNLNMEAKKMCHKAHTHFSQLVILLTWKRLRTTKKTEISRVPPMKWLP